MKQKKYYEAVDIIEKKKEWQESTSSRLLNNGPGIGRKNNNYSKFFKSKNQYKSFFNLRGIINYQLTQLGIKKIHNII